MFYDLYNTSQHDVPTNLSNKCVGFRFEPNSCTRICTVCVLLVALAIAKAIRMTLALRSLSVPDLELYTNWIDIGRYRLNARRVI